MILQILQTMLFLFLHYHTLLMLNMKLILHCSKFVHLADLLPYSKPAPYRHSNHGYNELLTHPAIFNNTMLRHPCYLGLSLHLTWCWLIIKVFLTPYHMSSPMIDPHLHIEFLLSLFLLSKTPNGIMPWTKNFKLSKKMAPSLYNLFF